MCTDSPRAALAPVSFGNVPIILTPHVRGPGESGGIRSRFTSAPVAGTVTQSQKGGCTQQGLEIRPHTPATLAPSLPWGGGETAVGSTALEQGLPGRDRPTEVSCLSPGRREDLGPPLGLGREPGDSGIAKPIFSAARRHVIGSLNTLFVVQLSLQMASSQGSQPTGPHGNGQPRARRRALRSYR